MHKAWQGVHHLDWWTSTLQDQMCASAFAQASVKRQHDLRSCCWAGVEMEALTAAAIAGLTVYDMCKAMDHGIILDGLQLVHKAGGKTGTWRRSDESNLHVSCKI